MVGVQKWRLLYQVTFMPSKVLFSFIVKMSNPFQKCEKDEIDFPRILMFIQFSREHGNLLSVRILIVGFWFEVLVHHQRQI